MYIGKNKGEIRANVKDVIHIPENYAGNAFSQKDILVEEAPPCEEKILGTKEETAECSFQKEEEICAYIPSEAPRSKPCLKLDKLFSADALLILLAVLFLGTDEEEIALILLLLLLF